MSEIQKHIESCRAEDPIAQTMEACGNESDIQAALQPLLVETMPGYVPVATTAPTSPIAELPNVLISIIRRVATKPLAILGDRPAKQSLLGSLVTTWNAIRQRLSGNPSAGIPDRRADMSGHSLPTALALLNDRKITGVPEAVDGMSMARILCDSAVAATITEITDDNVGWTMTKAFPASLFPALKRLILRCAEAFITQTYCVSGTFESLSMDEVERFSGINVTLSQERFDLPKLKSASMGMNVNIIQVNGSKELYMDEFEVFEYVGNAKGVHGDSLEVISMKKFRGLNSSAGWPRIIGGITPLRKVVWGKISGNSNVWGQNDKPNFNNCPNLIHLEFGQDIAISINIPMWSPTNALDASRTDLIEEGSTAQNNLQQFLQNFRSYIALRLTDNGSGLTLTLSQAVYDTIKDESHLFVFDEGTMTIYAYLTNIKHWTVTK